MGALDRLGTSVRAVRPDTSVNTLKSFLQLLTYERKIHCEVSVHYTRVKKSKGCKSGSNKREKSETETEK